MLVLAGDLVNSLHLTQKLLKEEQQQHISIKNKYADAQSDLFTLRKDLAHVRLQLTTTTEAFKRIQEDYTEAKHGFEQLQSKLAEEQNSRELALHQLDSIKSEIDRLKLNENVAKYACVVLPIIVGLFFLMK